MPFADLADVRLHFRLDGPDDADVLMLSNSLGTNLDMWESQMPALSAKLRVLRYDTRGHGQSSVPPGPYTIAQLGRDVVALLDHLEARARPLRRRVDGRHDGDVAGRACAGTGRQAHARQHRRASSGRLTCGTRASRK